MSAQLFKVRKLALAITTVLLVSCAHEASKEEMAKATEGFAIQDTNKLFVVDCLLPGQVRKLGSQMTYLSQRRPIRTSAADCEVRGGEYVAYDRADYASALKIWLPKAQEGDAEAQMYVGEIFEKGLGAQVDYQAAAQWYEKAANQGNFQAQLNLGHLYEKGLGVAQNQETALRWYRKSAGLEEANIPFTPAVSAQVINSQNTDIVSSNDNEMAALREEVAKTRQEADELRQQLQSTREQAMQQQDSLRKAQDELENLRHQLQQQKSAAPAGSSEITALEQQLQEKETQLKDQQAKLGSLTKTLSSERKRMQRELQAARQPKPSEKAPENAKNELENRLNEKIVTYQTQSAELTDWLTSGKPIDRQKIDARKQALQQQAREIASLKEQLDRQAPTQLASGNGPNIELLEPSVTVTRGIPSIQFNSGESSKRLIGRVDSKTGLRELLLNDKPLTVDSSGQFQTDVALKGNETVLSLVATDKRQQTSHLNVRLLAAESTEAPELAGSSNIAPTRQAGDIQFGQFYALIIGNNAYSAYPELKTPMADAKSVDVLLRERYGFKTKLLLNANRHAIMSALHELNQKMTAQDNLLIYYAGHGEIDQKSQSAYWLPVDSETGNRANWISSQSITEYLSIMSAKHIMVVADSCYSGALTGSAVAKLPDGMDAAKRERWLKAMNSRKARTVLTSGGVKPVMDQGGGTHSVFANAFLKVLRSNQRIIEDYDVFRDVANQVRASAAKAGFQQNPQYAPLQHAGHEGSPFFFVPEA